MSVFFQSLVDNFEQRFPAENFLNSASCLNRAMWPKDPLDRALFGEADVARLCKDLQMSTAEAAEVVVEYAVCKQSDGSVVGKKLLTLLNLLQVLPVSSADCERGFSQMNLFHTSLRNRLNVSTIDNFMMLSINSPPLAAWDPTKYVVSWLKSGHHGALDKATGVAKKPTVPNHSSKLFGHY